MAHWKTAALICAGLAFVDVIVTFRFGFTLSRGGERRTRTEHPVFFWSAIVGMTGLGLLFLWTGLRS